MFVTIVCTDGFHPVRAGRGKDGEALSILVVRTANGDRFQVDERAVVPLGQSIAFQGGALTLIGGGKIPCDRARKV